MWKFSSEDILHLKHPELLPFLPLTQDGATREIVELMFARLADEQHHELALFGFSFAALIFCISRQYQDQEWLARRFRHMHDILRDSPVYEWILAEGREEGKAQGIIEGRQQGLQQGIQQGIQDAAINMVIARFPELEQLARIQITAVDNLERLQHLIIDLSIAHSQDEMKRVLLSLDA